MRSPVPRVLPLVALLLLVGLPALAQQDEESSFSIGVGAGLVQVAGSSDPYLTANLRVRLGDRGGEEPRGSVYGFLEPEVARWSRSDTGYKSEDTLIGANIGGAVRLQSFEYFVACGAAYHMLDQKGTVGAQTFKADGNGIGVNAQFGFDVHLGESVSLFGVGRYDLVQESDDQKALHRRLGRPSEDQQSKAYLGIRFHL